MSKRLFGLTAIGMTSFSALKRSPGCSEPSGCSVYIPISPSSALETKTNVAASAGAPETMDSRTAIIAAFIVVPPLDLSQPIITPWLRAHHRRAAAHHASAKNAAGRGIDLLLGEIWGAGGGRRRALVVGR